MSLASFSPESTARHSRPWRTTIAVIGFGHRCGADSRYWSQYVSERLTACPAWSGSTVVRSAIDSCSSETASGEKLSSNASRPCVVSVIRASRVPQVNALP